MKYEIERMNPQVSVLMSVYNASETLCAAIESILNQTLADFEFIICDDASTDDSWKIIEMYSHKDKRIRTIKNEKNIGLGASLNHWFSHCAMGSILPDKMLMIYQLQNG